MFRNIAQQRGESDYADAIRSGMMNIREQPSEDAAAIQNLIGAEGINEGYDATQENALRAAFRAGGGMGDVAAKVGAARSNDLRKLFAGNNQAAKDEAYNRYSTRVGNEANKYNMFAARGSAMPAVQYNPKDIGGETGNLLSRAAGAGANAAGAALNAYAQPGPQLKYEAPVNYGMAKTLMTAGSDLSNMFGGMNFNFGGNYGSSNSYGYPAAPSGKYQEGKGLW
jgi:hypothetical protein